MQRDKEARYSLFSLNKFHYLNMPRVGILLVYNDFECTFKCLQQRVPVIRLVERPQGIQTRQKLALLLHCGKNRFLSRLILAEILMEKCHV